MRAGEPVAVLTAAFKLMAPFLKTYTPFAQNYDLSRACVLELQEDVHGLLHAPHRTHRTAPHAPQKWVSGVPNCASWSRQGRRCVAL